MVEDNIRRGMYVCVYVYICVCIYVCVCVCIYDWVTLLYSRNSHNLVTLIIIYMKTKEEEQS